ncbi:MAG: recombination protein RecR [Desulfomonile tiedjei]|uniref:Recombination protein RecR n=1 Tax=Desulfomonile tiedjei TaxID=2358 RepID=A0A9D6V0J4_9BACT|nr:recombination protein RecR [Desulfomonile tiedjei]
MVGPLEELINALKRLPGVGEKTATRYAFYVMNANEEEIQELVRTIGEVKQKLRLCSRCFHLTDVDPCEICSNTKRDASRMCVIETPMDLIAIEKAGHFKGVYHVLHGVLSPLDAIGPSDIRLSELLDRVRNEDTQEVILALNPTVEGESTAAYIGDRLKGHNVVVSRIAYGIPVGGSLEYSDPLTLSRALENRKKI